MLCAGRALDRIATAPHGMEAWRLLFQAYSPKTNARLVVMMLEVLTFPLDTNVVVYSLEKTERKIKEFERYGNIEIPDFLKIGIVIRQVEEGPMENASHHELAQVGNIPGHQDRSDERQAGPECSEGEIGRRNGRGCLHEGIHRCFQQVLARNRTQK